MSRYSVTMIQTGPDTHRHPWSYLGYEDERIDTYYTGRVDDRHGVAIAMMINSVMVQFFPWDRIASANGHEVYATFLMSKAATTLARDGVLFKKYPFLLFEGDPNDVLAIKCMVEEGRQQLEKLYADDQAVGAVPTAGQTLE